MGLGSLHSLAVPSPHLTDGVPSVEGLVCTRAGLLAPAESEGAARHSPGRASGLVTGAGSLTPPCVLGGCEQSVVPVWLARLSLCPHSPLLRAVLRSTGRPRATNCILTLSLGSSEALP